jgi:hypothetical protein
MKVTIMTQPLRKNFGASCKIGNSNRYPRKWAMRPVAIDRQPEQPSAPYKAARLAY